MSDLLTNSWQLLVSAVLGGIAGFFFKTVLNQWYGERTQARQKLQFYAKHLFGSCSLCRERFEGLLWAIDKKQKPPDPQDQGWRKFEHLRILDELALPVQANPDLGWVTKEGYLLISSAYLLASVSAWIGMYERDVAVLDFRRERVTNRFLKLVETFKRSATESAGIERNNLYYHYLDGAGTWLVKGTSLMSFAEFARALCEDGKCRAYFDEVFCYLHDVAAGKHTKQVRRMDEALYAILTFLQKYSKIPRAWMQFGVIKNDPLND